MTEKTVNPNPPAAAPKEARAWQLLWIVPLLMIFIALISFNPDDIEFCAGGLTGPGYPYNRLGPFGAVTVWILLQALGIAAYPFWVLCSLCFLRRVIIPFGVTPIGWPYRLAIPLFGLSLSFLFGLYPEMLCTLTQRLNIYQLPGGILGVLFSAPPTGFAYRLFNATGVFIIALALLLLSCYIIWKTDWQNASLPLWQFFQSTLRRFSFLNKFISNLNQQNEIEEDTGMAGVAQQASADTASFPPPQSPVMESAPPQYPQQPVPQAITPTDFAPGFRTRRGDASIAAARAAEAAFNARPDSQPTAFARRRDNDFTPTAPPPPPVQPQLPNMMDAPASKPRPMEMPVAKSQPELPINGIAEGYMLPDAEALYTPSQTKNQAASADEVRQNAEIIQATLDEFNVNAEVRNAIPGPQITLFEIAMSNGTSVKNIARLQEDLQMALKAQNQVRLLLPIAGKDCAGIEVPNRVRLTVTAHELFASDAWKKTKKIIPVILGKNIVGDTIVIDLAKAPHLIVAGSTGSGKSVCVNLMIQSMLLHFRPEDLKLIMFDPKFLEFQPYANLPHLISPIINDAAKVGVVLRWACEEMDHRYQLISAAGVKNLAEFNARKIVPDQQDYDGNPLPDRLPYIVIIIDELADIMALNGKEVELSLGRLAAKSRAAGIHLIVATQRPDSKVITGTIKNNFPWRVALKVTSRVNSSIVLDSGGAETLLGYGDMLFAGGETSTPIERIQGGWVTNEEIAAVVSRCCEQAEQVFDPAIVTALEAHDNEEALTSGAATADEGSGGEGGSGDDWVQKALNVIKLHKQVSTSLLQRKLGIGYPKAAKLMDQLESDGYIGPANPGGASRAIYWDNFPGYDSGDE